MKREYKTQKKSQIFQCEKNSISPNGFMFLQEAHSSVDDKKR